MEVLEQEKKIPGWQKALEARKAKAGKIKDDIEDIDLGFEIDPTRTYVFETIEKSPTPRYVTLGAQAKAFDPRQKRYIYLRYLPAVDTIFQEDQHESWDEETLPPLIFSRDQIEVKGENRRLMEYMMVHPLREGSPYALQDKKPTFRMRDKDIEEKILAKRHELERMAIMNIEKTSIDDLRPIARVIFGIMEDDELAVRNKLHTLAKTPKQPKEPKSGAELIIDNVGNQRLLREFYVQIAFDKGILNPDYNSMCVKWSDTGATILTLNSKKHVKEVTEFTFSHDGAAFYTELKRKLT